MKHQVTVHKLAAFSNARRENYQFLAISNYAEIVFLIKNSFSKFDTTRQNFAEYLRQHRKGLLLNKIRAYTAVCSTCIARTKPGPAIHLRLFNVHISSREVAAKRAKMKTNTGKSYHCQTA